MTYDVSSCECITFAYQILADIITGRMQKVLIVSCLLFAQVLCRDITPEQAINGVLNGSFTVSPYEYLFPLEPSMNQIINHTPQQL